MLGLCHRCAVFVKCALRLAALFSANLRVLRRNITHVVTHRFDLIADRRIRALLRERAHALRLPAAVLRFCFRHWIHSCDEGNGHRWSSAQRSWSGPPAAPPSTRSRSCRQSLAPEMGRGICARHPTCRTRRCFVIGLYAHRLCRGKTCSIGAMTSP